MADESEGVFTKRRYYLLKAQEAYRAGDGELGSVWWSKQDGIAGTALPSTVPLQSSLATAHYTKLEDFGTMVSGAFRGATSRELVASGLSRSEADAVLSAVRTALGV